MDIMDHVTFNKKTRNWIMLPDRIRAASCNPGLPIL